MVKMHVEIDLEPIMVPSVIYIANSGNKSVAVGDVPADVLSQLCDDFRRNLFKDAGKRDPRETAKEAASEQAAGTAERPTETTPDSEKTDPALAAYMLEGFRKLLIGAKMDSQHEDIEVYVEPRDPVLTRQLLITLRVIRDMEPIDISASLVGNQPRPAYGVDAEDLRQVLEILSNSTIHADDEQNLSVEIMTCDKAEQLIQLLWKLLGSFWATRPEYRRQRQDQ